MLQRRTGAKLRSMHGPRARFLRTVDRVEVLIIALLGMACGGARFMSTFTMANIIERGLGILSHLNPGDSSPHYV